MGVSRVVCVARSVVVNECVGRDVLVDDEGRDPDAQAREVVCDVVLVRHATK